MKKETQLIITADGSHSVAAGSEGLTYHSKHGAIQESRHVFIDAALRYRAANSFSSPLQILEIGFGTGLNALMTLLEAEKEQWAVDYCTYELFPLAIDQAEALNYPEMLLAPQSRLSFEEFHRSDWETAISIAPSFTFTKKLQSFLEISANSQYDIVYFDPFAPNAQPEFWEPSFLQKMYTALRPGGVLTTYCAKGVVKRSFKALGFEVETLPGPPGKREMVRAKKGLD